ncbi:four helix bundle protein [Dyella mobilis]|uniref:Four helix bundle protein n=1 Tax=Dyella mobilis TaxID=1849582 RepID=A0ABS2KKB3_9GAMM|nr:four helix bundle protein [Dyella mobilis]MBM7131598.1 four helix bundle protein [Dyella mobilis]GLQ96427.1 hypothetical protein GCM10007863_08450 [Dyella mobilis]
MLDIEKSVLQFPKRHQHVSGQQLRQQIFKVVQLASRAWCKPAERLTLVEALDEAIIDFRITFQLAKRLQAFASFGQFEDLARKLAELGREVGGWKRQLHPKGQNAVSRAKPQRASTLSTPSASTCEVIP